MWGMCDPHLTLMSALYFLPLTMPNRVGVWLSLKFRVTSYTAFTVRQKIQINNQRLHAEHSEDCGHVCLKTQPVPFRQCSVVVNPLVRGSRWYLSLGRPLLSATCILIWCFFSVKRVPSQYSRNCGGKRVFIYTADMSSFLLSIHNPYFAWLNHRSIQFHIMLK